MMRITKSALNHAAQQLVEDLGSDPIGNLLPLNKTTPEETETGGFCISVATLEKSRLDVAIWFDKFLDGKTPVFWAGFGSATRIPTKKLIAKCASYVTPSATLSGRDQTKTGDIWHLKPNRLSNLEGPVAEYYGNSNGFGIYCHPDKPFDRNKASNFIIDVLGCLSLGSPKNLAAMEKKYLSASPEVKEKLSKRVERGPIGALVKRATGFKCQMCEALRLNPIGFLKRNGEHYVEAHHVMPVAKQQVGTLAASNVMTLCANHHRQIHYGRVEVEISETTFNFIIEETPVEILRLDVIGASLTSSTATGRPQVAIAAR